MTESAQSSFKSQKSVSIYYTYVHMYTYVCTYMYSCVCLCNYRIHCLFMPIAGDGRLLDWLFHLPHPPAWLHPLTSLTPISAWFTASCKEGKSHSLPNRSKKPDRVNMSRFGSTKGKGHTHMYKAPDTTVWGWVGMDACMGVHVCVCMCGVWCVCVCAEALNTLPVLANNTWIPILSYSEIICINSTHKHHFNFLHNVYT